MNPTYQAVAYALDSANSYSDEFMKSLSKSGLKATEVKTSLKSQKVYSVQRADAKNMLDASVTVRKNGDTYSITANSSDKALNQAVKGLIDDHENQKIAQKSEKARGKFSDSDEVKQFRVIPPNVASMKIADINSGKIARVTGELAQGGAFNGHLSIKRMTGQRKTQFDVLLHIGGLPKPIKFGVAREDMTIKDLSDYLAIDDKDTKIDFSIIGS